MFCGFVINKLNEVSKNSVKIFMQIFCNFSDFKDGVLKESHTIFLNLFMR